MTRIRGDRMRKLAFVLFLTLPLFWSAPASALSELNARVRETVFLKSQPSPDSSDTSVQVAADETVFVLGTSVDTTFVQVLKRNGETGWLQVNLADLYRVDRSDYDDYYYALMRERAYTSRWNFHLGASYGVLPFGVGAEGLVNLNIFRRGVFDSNVDQLEFGSGFKYHVGADPKPVLLGDGTLFSKPARPFWELPVQLLWLFRLGYRGETLLGPRIGFSVIQDRYSRFDTALPGLTGFELRHYPRDTLGLSWNVWVHLRSVIYYSTSFGVDFRF
jgi:hypothetical protein